MAPAPAPPPSQGASRPAGGGQRWLELERRRRASPFCRLIDRSFGFRLVMAGVAALAVLALVNRFENCHRKLYAQDCLSSNVLEVISIDNVESLSIVTAAFLFILEGRKRKRQDHREAMELVMACQQAGVVMSLGRLEALETLSDAGLWLDGFDLHGTNLEGLRAEGGRWRGVNLSGAMLQGASFAGSDLSGANLRGADLRAADLRGARLRGADLRGADLAGARTEGSDLSDARLGPDPGLEPGPEPAPAPGPGPDQAA